jgi:acyl-CoA thioesterase FadM
MVRGSALLGYVQDVAWRHSEALGFPRAWYREKGVAWLVRAVEARILAPIADGETVAVTTRLTGYRKVMARRETEVTGPGGELRAVVLIDWAMTDGRAPVRIPADFEHAPIDGPGPFTPIRVDLPPSPPDTIALQLTPRLRELDRLNHANNGVFLDWLDEAVAAAGTDGDAAIAGHPRTYRWSTSAQPSPGPRSSHPLARRHRVGLPPGGRGRHDLLRACSRRVVRVRRPGPPDGGPVEHRRCRPRVSAGLQRGGPDWLGVDQPKQVDRIREVAVEDPARHVEQLEEIRVADVVDDGGAASLGGHDVAAAQDGQLLRDRRRGCPDRLLELPDAQRSRAEQLEDRIRIGWASALKNSA